jgi:hypothetical protein
MSYKYNPFTGTFDDITVATVASAASGTAAAPGIAFTTDINTGIYSPGADTIATVVGGTEAVRIDSSGRLLVGTSTSTNNIRFQQNIAGVAVGTSNYAGASFTSYAGTTDVAGPLFDLQRSRGTTDGSMTKVESGDRLGSIIFRGSDGSQFVDAAAIGGFVDGTTGANDMPTRLVFFTTADGAASSTERMRIKSTGIINFSNAPTYADNTAATAGGLAVGDVYKTVLGVLMIRF